MFMLRCCELGINQVLNDMTIGMVYDMLIEQSNDTHDYPTLATQEDMDKL